MIDTIELPRLIDFVQPRISREMMETLLLADETGSMIDDGGDSPAAQVTGKVAEYVNSTPKTENTVTSTPTESASSGSDQDKLNAVLAKIRRNNG